MLSLNSNLAPTVAFTNYWNAIQLVVTSWTAAIASSTWPTIMTHVQNYSQDLRQLINDVFVYIKLLKDKVDGHAATTPAPTFWKVVAFALTFGEAPGDVDMGGEEEEIILSSAPARRRGGMATRSQAQGTSLIDMA